MSLSHLATTTTISSPISGNPLRKSTVNNRGSVRLSNRTPYTSCELNHKKNQETTHNATIDRRNLLLGLGGMYGATATIANNAIGAPMVPPDLATCHLATDDELADKNDPTKGKVKCCPPYSAAKINEFKPPSSSEPLRVRKAAHKYNSDDIVKFEEAIRRMRALPADDPWNFNQQATIHCTFCNGAFDQLNTKTLLQIHGSWFFLPWHRYYLYFWERILGKLINDDTFAIPFWNWDSPKGMYLPQMYQPVGSPLDDGTRNKDHYASVIDYKYSIGDPNPSTPAAIDEVVTRNLAELDSIFKETLQLPALFMGKAQRGGEAAANAQGRNEGLHNVFHQWVGPTQKPYHNMGNFATAGRDPIFYGHHGNVDRMWDVYSKLRGQKVEFRDPDWLESSFIFYDENRQVVSVKVKDCLTPESLRYSYSPEPLAWTTIRRKYKKLQNEAQKRSAGDSLRLKPVSVFGSQPRPLTEPIQVLVQRPKTSRTKDQKADSVEVLFIDGIQISHGSTARFDVYVTKPIEGLVGPHNGELAGSYVKVPHASHGSSNGTHKTDASLELGISTLLEEIDAESSDKLVVSLIPRNGDVVVGGVQIRLVDVDDDDL